MADMWPTHTKFIALCSLALTSLLPLAPPMRDYAYTSTRQPVINRLTLLAHWSVRQKLNHVSCVQFSYVALNV